MLYTAKVFHALFIFLLKDSVYDFGISYFSITWS
jgi:hypothetical protein